MVWRWMFSVGPIGGFARIVGEGNATSSPHRDCDCCDCGVFPREEAVSCSG